MPKNKKSEVSDLDLTTFVPSPAEQNHIVQQLQALIPAFNPQMEQINDALNELAIKHGIRTMIVCFSLPATVTTLENQPAVLPMQATFIREQSLTELLMAEHVLHERIEAILTENIGQPTGMEPGTINFSPHNQATA